MMLTNDLRYLPPLSVLEAINAYEKLNEAGLAELSGVQVAVISLRTTHGKQERIDYEWEVITSNLLPDNVVATIGLDRVKDEAQKLQPGGSYSDLVLILDQEGSAIHVVRVITFEIADSSVKQKKLAAMHHWCMAVCSRLRSKSVRTAF